MPRMLNRAGNGVERMAGQIARGGKAVYRAPLGILMLDARIPGDMSHAAVRPRTWDWQAGK